MIYFAIFVVRVAESFLWLKKGKTKYHKQLLSSLMLRVRIGCVFDDTRFHQQLSNLLLVFVARFNHCLEQTSIIV